MNVALRALHDALAGDGDVAERWRSFVSTIPDGPLRAREVEDAARRAGVRGRGIDWCADLRRLGAVDADGALERDRAANIGTALEIAADSFVSVETDTTWAPVATLPSELRTILRPHPVRQTAGLFLEIIDSAAEELLLAAPFVDQRAVEFVTDALVAAGARNVDLTILTSAAHGQRFRDLEHRWSSDCSGALDVFEITTDISLLGSHAKVLVADRVRAYVGSANLTSAGLGRQVEIGVELRGPQTAALTELLRGLERLGRRVTPVARSKARRRD